MGIYVDCDVFCLKPLPERDYLFGWEQSHQINNAVLNLPKDSELLQAMIAFTAQKYPIPPWLKPEKRIVLQVRRAIGLPVHVARQSWGTYGPVALTYFIKKLGLAHHALPIDYFYAFYGNFWPLLAEEGLSLSDLITPRSYAIHLSASGLGDTKIKPRTPLAELVEA
ncbi:MAG: hypothetical protein P4L98_19645 [Ancalomicrobiaceae bacterium]|nr:hypothetical protein [Ancalomicrobiaceae bacterium]